MLRRSIPLLALALMGCRTPTSVTLEISSDVSCEDLRGVTIATGTREGIESAAAATTTTQCTMQADGMSRIGTLVIVPSGSNDAELAVRVIAGVDRPVADCTAANGYDGCIVVRRFVRFEPNTEQRLPIRLANDCKGVGCDATTTCVRKGCRNAEDLSVPDLPEDAGVDAPPSETGDATPDVPAECKSGEKNCGGKCVAVTDPAYGCSVAGCSPCGDATSSASYTCDGETCKPTGCKAGFKQCDGACVPMDAAHGCGATSCVPCPSTNGTASCDGAACKLTCSSGYKLCGGKCVSVSDPTYGCGATTCDASSCPTSGTVVCSGGSCVLGACGAGTKPCGGKCVPIDANNGCGDVTRCSPCAAGESCVGGPPSTCQCVPEAKSVTCSGVECGSKRNNCGQLVDCGSSCAAPKTCGGGGTPNACGCTPSGSPCDGSKCGTLTDSCGNAVSCGCTGSNTCGGGGTPGVCGCTPVNPCDGSKCGTLSNGCGGTATCSCTAPNTCGGGGTPGVCGCTPIDTATACAEAGQVCGRISNGCGTFVSCGFCAGTCCFDSCSPKGSFCP